MSAASGSDAAFCAEQVRSHAFERYASTLFLKPEQRRAMLALTAFDLEVGRVRDHVTQPLPGEIRLQWWADLLAGLRQGEAEGNPVAAELMNAVSRFGLPIERLDRLIDARRYDLYDDPMPTMAALESYLVATSSALFGLGARVLGGQIDDATDHLARHAGIADGLVRVMALLPRHAARRQLYLPLELVAQYGVASEQVFSGVATPQLSRLLEHLRAEARGHLATAIRLLDAAAPLAARPIFLPLVWTTEMLARMSGADADPFRPANLSRLRVLWRLWRAAHSGPFSS